MSLRTLFTMSMRNLGSRRTRVILTMLAIVYSVALMVTLETMTYGFKVAITSEVENILPTDLMVYSQSVSIPEEVAQVIARLPHVSYVVPAIILGTVQVNGQAVTLIGIPSQYFSYFEVHMENGSMPASDGEAIIQDTLASEGNVSIGDTIYAQVLTGVQGSTQIIPLKVTGTFSSILGGFLGFHLNMIVTTIGTLQDDLGDAGFINAIFIKLSQENPTYLNQLATALSEYFPNADVYEQSSVLGSISNALSMVNLFFVVIIALSLIVTGLSVANTAIMNVRERTREIGILKALGASNRQVIIIFLLEVIIMSIVGSALGIVLGIGGAYLARYIMIKINVPIIIPVILLPTLYLYSLLIAVATSIVASVPSLISITRIRPMEVLRIE
ncbi:ABC transporter permease [Vulcanisaeta souniana]|uniref:ABC transporter permease n=3 Tax=Vulcanisaeta souniana TaxID=164452 RepID=A0ABN6SPM4_9CREN|nr:FtsX-like permease family protein [Vulcanisaeta souniana]BDR91328.1 ABC transporter permease [Vulcanisaeta souniana JCM 11219]